MNLQRIKQLAGIKLNESVESVPAIGGSESDMQTAGTIGRDQAYAAYDASQTPATEGCEDDMKEEFDLGNDADTELGWYIIGATDGAIAAGPYKSSPHARRDAERKTWYLANRNNYDVAYGFDDNGYFVDADLTETEEYDDMDSDAWAERLAQEYDKNKELENGSEFDPKLDEKAPPGMEDMVMKLKKQYPGEPEKAFATAWSIYNKTHGKTEESTCMDETSPTRLIVQQCIDRIHELRDSFVEPEKAAEIVEQELYDQGYDNEDISYIMHDLEQEMNHSGLHTNSDDMYEERDTSKLPQNLNPEEINELLNLPVDAAKNKAVELINKTTTRPDKKDFLIRQVESGLSSKAVVKLLYDMLLAGEGHRVHGSSYSKKFSEDFDLNNGYDDINDANGDDYFPDGADSPVIKATGASGARQGDNPEQKKMQIAELHKELVYGYRNFLNEAEIASKKKLNENQQLVSGIKLVKFHDDIGINPRSNTIDYTDNITLRATVLDNNNNPVEIQYTIAIYAEADIEWGENDAPVGWNHGADEPRHETYAEGGIGNGTISDVEFVDDSFSIGGKTRLSIEAAEKYINPESLKQLLDPNSYTEIIGDKFEEASYDLNPEDFVDPSDRYT